MKVINLRGTATHRLLIALSFAILLGPRVSVAAEEGNLTVVLRDRRNIHGELLSLDRRQTRMRVGSARTLSFRTANIVRLDSLVPYTVETSAGETIDGKISVRTNRLGPVLYVAADKLRKFPLSTVVSVAPGPASEQKAEADAPPGNSRHQEAQQTKDVSDGELPDKGKQAAAPQAVRAPDPAAKASPASRDGQATKDSKDSTDPKDSGTAKDHKDAKIGKPRPDAEDAHSMFLRQAAVLLASRQMEIEMDVAYLYSRWYDPTQNRLTYSRYAETSFALSVGIASFVQASVSAPLVYHQEHTFQSTDGQENISQSLRPGNVSAALNVQVLRSTETWPDVMVFADVSAPLGTDSASAPGPTGKVRWGSWSTDAGISFVKTTDPVSLVGSLVYSHGFSQTIGGQLTQPGDFWGYMVGIGFAANSKLSLATSVRGGWEGPTRVGGKRVVETEAEPMAVTGGIVYAIGKSWYVSPSVSFPINDEGGVVVLRSSLARRF